MYSYGLCSTTGETRAYLDRSYIGIIADYFASIYSRHISHGNGLVQYDNEFPIKYWENENDSIGPNTHQISHIPGLPLSMYGTCCRFH